MVRLFDNTRVTAAMWWDMVFPSSLPRASSVPCWRRIAPTLECGNCKGVGCLRKAGRHPGSQRREYYVAFTALLPKGRIGMFLQAKLADEALIRPETLSCTSFGSGLMPETAWLPEGGGGGKKAGLVCRCSDESLHSLSRGTGEKEAEMLQDAGIDSITIMDSAGTMFPEQTAAYVRALKGAVTIPVGFHGHSNLGLSQANALAAVARRSGRDRLRPAGHMARSAGNCATELAPPPARAGYLKDLDLYGLFALPGE